MRSALAAALAAVALAAGPGASLAADAGSRLVVATKHDGVRFVEDLRVGPLRSSATVSTLVDVRETWGQEKVLRRATCLASWGTGVRLLFTTFGGPAPCRERFLQQVTVVGKRWVVQIRGTPYTIGMPASDLPTGARYVAYLKSYELATMPFAGGRTSTVLAHVNRNDRVDRFVLFIGGAGD